MVSMSGVIVCVLTQNVGEAEEVEDNLVGVKKLEYSISVKQCDEREADTTLSLIHI